MLAARQPPETLDQTSILYPWAAEEGRSLAERVLGQTPLFVCVIASTDTALIPGISAAGASQDLIPYTSAADAEVIAHGVARCIAGVPSNPLGPPGPSLITRAALQLADLPHVIVDAGCHIQADAPRIRLGTVPGGLISLGNAVPNAQALFDSGFELGRKLAAAHPYIVLGESVPGGTTTALALLLALGFEAEGRVSSSRAKNAHRLKNRVAREALAHLSPKAVAIDPLAAVAVLGDPMQATAAGLALGTAAAGCPLLLAGGTQMVALIALIIRLAGVRGAAQLAGHIGVATTRWVADDPTADAVGLMAEIGSFPLLATGLSFAESRFAQLRRYEDFLVKEGVGAGGAAVAAHLAAGVPATAVAERVETLYEGLLGG